MVIVNGLGYDEWASQLLRSSPSSARVVLDVGKMLRLPAGANPHRWYYPRDVRAVIAAIIAGYDRLDPADAAYFAARRVELERRGLARYDALRAAIRARYAGRARRLQREHLPGARRRPRPEAGDAAELRARRRRGHRRHRGRQAAPSTNRRSGARSPCGSSTARTSRPDVQRVNELVPAARIPVVEVTETLTPADASFQEWQVAQLERLLRALRRGGADLAWHLESNRWGQQRSPRAGRAMRRRRSPRPATGAAVPGRRSSSCSTSRTARCRRSRSRRRSSVAVARPRARASTA